MGAEVEDSLVWGLGFWGDMNLVSIFSILTNKMMSLVNLLVNTYLQSPPEPKGRVGFGMYRE